VNDLMLSFRFSVALIQSPREPLGSKKVPEVANSGTVLGNGSFQECSGLELETDVRDYLEGGRNDGVLRRLGRVKLQPLVLKRGMFVASANGETTAPEGGGSRYVNTDLWAWLQGVVGDVRPVRRYDGIITVHRPRKDGEVMARWTFSRGLPIKVTGPALNGRTGDVAIEELHIAHQGLRLENDR
jgi:phage tail-like protein